MIKEIYPALNEFHISIKKNLKKTKNYEEKIKLIDEIFLKISMKIEEFLQTNSQLTVLLKKQDDYIEKLSKSNEYHKNIIEEQKNTIDKYKKTIINVSKLDNINNKIDNSNSHWIAFKNLVTFVALGIFIYKTYSKCSKIYQIVGVCSFIYLNLKNIKIL